MTMPPTDSQIRDWLRTAAVRLHERRNPEPRTSTDAAATENEAPDSPDPSTSVSAGPLPAPPERNTMDQYPTRIDLDNQFSVESIDLDAFTFPKLTLHTWSDIFGKGGSYVIQCDLAGEEAMRAPRLTSVSFEEPDSSIRANLELLVEDFNSDWGVEPKTEWLQIFTRAQDKVAAYYAKQVENIEELKRRAAVSVERQETLEAMTMETRWALEAAAAAEEAKS